MKTSKKILSLTIAFTLAFISLSCTPTVTGEKVDRSYPDDIVPIYDDAIVYDYENDDDAVFEIFAGSADELSDVAEYYSEYFDDEDIELSSESRNSSLYKASGQSDGWSFEIIVQKPQSTADKRSYDAIIEIYVESTGHASANVTNGSIDIGSNQQAIDILEAMQDDLQIIEDLIEESGSNDDMSLEEILLMFDKYIGRIEDKIAEIKTREVNEIQLIRIQNSEIVLFEMLSDLLSEVNLMSAYAIDLSYIYTNLGTEMGNALGSSDYETQYNIKEALAASIEDLSSVSVPTFLQFKHNNLIEKMNEFTLVAANFVWAYSIEDSLRLSNYNYFLDLYLRYFDNFVLGVQTDLTTRLTKYEEDIDFIKTWTSDLDYFINSALNTETLDLSLYKNEYLSIAEDILVSYNYQVPEDLIPANYRSMEHLVFLELWTNRGTTDVMVTVVIPEYTQVYKERVTVGSAETELAILPPLVTDIKDKLNTSKDSYVEITVEDIATGEIILQATEPILVNSIYDMRWLGPDELDYFVDILAWVTPENDKVLQLQRHAADSVVEISGGKITGIWGYQGDGGSMTQREITYYQTAALMNAMADAMNVKYINSSFSTTDWSIQRISTPERVLENASGLCIETSVTLASALVASRMNAMILLLPRHAQVAVETWYGSGEYLLVETTALGSAKSQNFAYVIRYYTKEEWQQYIYANEVVAIDCDMAGILDIHPID